MRSRHRRCLGSRSIHIHRCMETRMTSLLSTGTTPAAPAPAGVSFFDNPHDAGAAPRCSAHRPGRWRFRMLRAGRAAGAVCTLHRRVGGTLGGATRRMALAFAEPAASGGWRAAHLGARLRQQVGCRRASPVEPGPAFRTNRWWRCRTTRLDQLVAAAGRHAHRPHGVHRQSSGYCRLAQWLLQPHPRHPRRRWTRPWCTPSDAKPPTAPALHEAPAFKPHGGVQRRRSHAPWRTATLPRWLDTARNAGRHAGLRRHHARNTREVPAHLAAAPGHPKVVINTHRMLTCQPADAWRRPCVSPRLRKAGAAGLVALEPHLPAATTTPTSC